MSGLVESNRTYAERAIGKCADLMTNWATPYTDDQWNELNNEVEALFKEHEKDVREEAIQQIAALRDKHPGNVVRYNSMNAAGLAIRKRSQHKAD